MGFLTSAAICTTSFLLGVLFTSFLWDSTILFATEEVTETTIAAIETYYLTWWNGAMAVKMFLHIVVLATFMSLVAKFATYSETSFFFSGGSLLLLIMNVSLYISITLPSIRSIARDPLVRAEDFVANYTDLFTSIQAVFAKGNTGPLGDYSRKAASEAFSKPLITFSERQGIISVLCAANTMAVALLVGVLVLQIGEWYVEETVVKPVLEAEQIFLKERDAEKKDQ